MNKTRAVALALAAALFAIPAATARADYKDVVSAIEAKGGRQKGLIPLFGLVRLLVWVAHPDGVHDLQLAVWEGKPFTIDGRDIEPLIRAKAGDYRPMVSTRSRNGEWTYIYARPGRSNLVDLLVVAHDHDDTVVVRTVVDPERLGKEMSRHDHHHDGHDFSVAWR